MIRKGRSHPGSEPNRDKKGDTFAGTAVDSDTAGREEMEEALRQANERFDLAQRAAGAGVWDWDNKTGKVEWTSRMFDLFGLDPEHAAPSFGAWESAMHPDDREGALSRVHQALKDRSFLYNEFRVVLPGGEVRWISALGRGSYDGQDQPVRMTGICMDITERKEADDLMGWHRSMLQELVKERTAELEEKNRQLKEEKAEREKSEREKRRVEAQLAQAMRIESLDRFAGGIAHDLNNLLSPIIINLEELIACEPPDSDRRCILDETMKAALRQRDLIKKILSFGRKGEQVLKPTRIKPLLEETLAFLRSSLPSTIEIQQRIEVQSDVVVGDPVQIQQVLMNLCGNAADALEGQKGCISVGLKKTHLSPLHGHQGLREGEYLRLTVKDSGLGMGREVMDQIFEPFFTTKGVGKGTGMGLSIARGIVKGLGGTITVESEPGKGSMFKVYLPLSEEALPDREPEAGGAPSAGAGKRIMLVDDEESILISMQRVLKSAGYQVEAFSDSRVALDAFSRDPDGVDLVITDLTMPGMTGEELSRKLLNIRPMIPIILCTGFKDAISQQEAKICGIRQLLQKPVGTGDLKKVIHRVLEH
jgi:PAS domain S-box-containing protein